VLDRFADGVRFVPLAPLSDAALVASEIGRVLGVRAVLVARGYSNPEISAEFVIARRTVETHVTAILNKLGLSTRTQIAVRATQHDLHPSRPS
jgi:ATP/maltotriose-dependent transcriptional regulator MalT